MSADRDTCLLDESDDATDGQPIPWEGAEVERSTMLDQPEEETTE